MKHNKKGFTLAELLIVIAIIAVLAAIAIPTYFDHLEKVRLAVDHANIRTVLSLVAVANQTGEITVDGEILSLETAQHRAPYYILCNDGTLTAYTLDSGLVNDNVYRLQATGVSEDGGVCPICPGAPAEASGKGQPGMNLLHKKGNMIYVTVARLKGSYIAYLGYDAGMN